MDVWAAVAAGAAAVVLGSEVRAMLGVGRAVRAVRAATAGEWDARGERDAVAGKPEVTVVVCVRNGAAEVAGWAEAVRACQGPAFEVVAVDDGSNDGTPEELVAAAARWEPGRFRTVRVEGTAPGKREALATGVAAARADVVLATDIDCRPQGPDWVATMTAPLRRGAAEVVAGVSLPIREEGSEGRGVVRWVQLADDLRIARSYVAAAGWGRPYMTVGRNVAFLRELAVAMPSVAPQGVASGDDDLTLQAWIQTRPGVRVLADPRPEASTATAPAANLKAWARRKLRHLSAAPHYPAGVLLRLAVPSVAGVVAAAVGVVHTGLGIVVAAAVAVWLVQTCTLRAFACLAGLNGSSVWAGAAGPAAATGLAFLKAVTLFRSRICGKRTPTEPLKTLRRRPADDPWT